MCHPLAQRPPERRGLRFRQIGGWSTAGVGQAYGDGDAIEKKWEWLAAISQMHPKLERSNSQKPN